MSVANRDLKKILLSGNLTRFHEKANEMFYNNQNDIIIFIKEGKPAYFSFLPNHIRHDRNFIRLILENNIDITPFLDRETRKFLVSNYRYIDSFENKNLNVFSNVLKIKISIDSNFNESIEFYYNFLQDLILNGLTIFRIIMFVEYLYFLPGLTDSVKNNIRKLIRDYFENNQIKYSFTDRKDETSLAIKLFDGNGNENDITHLYGQSYYNDIYEKRLICNTFEDLSVNLRWDAYDERYIRFTNKTMYDNSSFMLSIRQRILLSECLENDGLIIIHLEFS